MLEVTSKAPHLPPPFDPLRQVRLSEHRHALQTSKGGTAVLSSQTFSSSIYPRHRPLRPLRAASLLPLSGRRHCSQVCHTRIAEFLRLKTGSADRSLHSFGASLRGLRVLCIGSGARRFRQLTGARKAPAQRLRNTWHACISDL